MNFLTNKSEDNIFVSLLETLNVKYTKWYSSKYYSEHPYKNSLYGLSKILFDYNIENKGGVIKDKKGALTELDTPFIAHVKNNFVIVYRIDKNNVIYILKGKNISVSHEEFIQTWSGNTLLIEKNENSIEPNYAAHYKQKILHIIERNILILSLVLILILSGIYTGAYLQTNFIISLIINIIGGYISYLLFLKQIHIHSNHADKICSLITQSDCNSILDSKVANVLNFSWSEIGLGYFISNIIIITFFPHLYSYLAVVNCFSLPYTIWSILYQKIIAKQWCPLCLIVQFILWSLFVLNIYTKEIIVPEFNWANLFLTVSIYTVSIILLNIMGDISSDLKDRNNISQELNSIKLDKDIFNMLINKKNKYEITKSNSNIILGNIESNNLITIITNPHCGPCAKLHKKIKKVLRENKCCIQYILTSFGSHFEESNKLIIAMYQKMEQDKFLDF